MNKAAIVLCGGHSMRMGQDKASMKFGNELTLSRIVRLISEVIAPDQISVVSAIDQDLPPLPVGIKVISDRYPDRGPLEGMSAGFHSLDPNAEAVFVTSCDIPLLIPKVIAHLFDRLGSFEAVVPRDLDRIYPLTAVYRSSAVTAIDRLLKQDKLRVRSLIEDLRACFIETEQLREFDANLDSFENLNRPEDYQNAIARLERRSSR